MTGDLAHNAHIALFSKFVRTGNPYNWKSKLRTLTEVPCVHNTWEIPFIAQRHAVIVSQLCCLYSETMRKKTSVFLISRETQTQPKLSLSNRRQKFLERLPLGTLKLLCGTTILVSDNKAQGISAGF